MPLYDYECMSCGHRFEIRQSFSAAPVAPCPVCQSKSRRVFHSVPILFKGSGFYSTDNKRGAASRSTNGREEKIEAKSEDKADAKSKDGAKDKPREKVASKAEAKGPSESASSKSD